MCIRDRGPRGGHNRPQGATWKPHGAVLKEVEGVPGEAPTNAKPTKVRRNMPCGPKAPFLHRLQFTF
eukprot:5565375-Lingulodinium_polyedra.AAC.1